MDLNFLCIPPESAINSAIEILNKAPSKGLPSNVVLIQKPGAPLEGIITDGDLRRGFSQGIHLEDPVSKIMNQQPVTFPDHLDVTTLFGKVHDSIQESKKEGKFRNNRMSTIICTNTQGSATRVYNFIDLWRNTQVQHRPICILGTGFVGLTLAVTFTDCGFQVTGVDPSDAVHEAIQKRQSHFHEKGINPLINRYLGNRLTIKRELSQSIGDIYVIAVGTPVDEQKNPQLDHLKNAARSVGRVLKEGDLVILRSTVPVGTCRHVIAPILEEQSGLKIGRDLYLAFAPERTVEGKALEELRTLPQVIGGYDEASTNLTAALFRTMSPNIVNVSSLEAAEMVKLVNNTYRDTCFAFANELAETCDGLHLDVHEVISSANNGYPRNPLPLPSPGVGGICLKKDPHIYSSARKNLGLPASMASRSREINSTYPSRLADKIHSRLQEFRLPTSSPIFVCGFAFKGIPETSDTRESTTLDFVSALKNLGYKNILSFDPVVSFDELKALGTKPVNLEEGFSQSPITCFMNNHSHWTSLNLFDLTSRMPKPALIFDTWNLFMRREIDSIEGVRYIGLSDPQ